MQDYDYYKYNNIQNRSSIVRKNIKPRSDFRVYPAQTGTQNLGSFQLNAISTADNRPIENAKVSISYSAEGNNNVIEELVTDNTGRTPIIELPTPPIDYSLDPTASKPYSDYNCNVAAQGFEPIVVNGSEVLPSVRSIQTVNMNPLPTAGEGTAELIVIPDHTLYGDYPPKIIEDEVKEVGETGEIVLLKVVIPEFVIVHDGPPEDSAAKNYYVRYRDYIKNVASSEIYATWPESTIIANILAIQSFTLNRVFTEWYQGKGFNFTITSSTAFDHKWMPGRNIFDTIGRNVDNIFNNYLSRPNIKQPILTQYCDGHRVSCPGLMTQWGSKDLGEAGSTAIEILRHFYGSNMFINTTEEVSGVPSSFPGFTLSIGTRNESVRQLQEQLNVLANVYYPINSVAVDGVYGQQTADAVREFQKLFDLPETGTVDFATWYKISDIYVAVSRIAEYQ